MTTNPTTKETTTMTTILDLVPGQRFRMTEKTDYMNFNTGRIVCGTETRTYVLLAHRACADGEIGLGGWDRTGQCEVRIVETEWYDNCARRNRPLPTGKQMWLDGHRPVQVIG